MKSFTLHAGNVQKVLDNMKKKLKANELRGTYFVIASTRWTRSSRYRGRGRPRKSDYDYNEICLEDFNFGGI